MASIELNLIVRITRRAARILASLACILFAALIITNTVSQSSFSYFVLEIPNLILTILAIILGILLAWWDDLPAGIFMIILSVVVRAMANFNCWLILGVPLLVAGLLFILLWLISLMRQRSLRKAEPL